MDMGTKCVKSGGNRWKSVKMPYPQCGRRIKICRQTTMMPRVSQSIRSHAQIVAGRALRLRLPLRLQHTCILCQ